MKHLFISLVTLLMLSTSLHASVEEYKKLHDEANQHYREVLHKTLPDILKSASAEVKDAYKSIGYRPVWTDSDALSGYGLALLGEIKDDLAHGALTSLKAPYESMLERTKTFSSKTPLKEKQSIEAGMMQLFVDHINAIISNTKNNYTPASLLKDSLNKGSLVHCYNTISNVRILKRMPALKAPETIDENLTKMLTKGTKEARLKAIYKALHYQPVWVSKQGLTSFSKTLFHAIETDPIFDHTGPTWKRFMELKALPVPKDEKALVKREFAIARLYQDYMGYLLYGAIDWKKFQHKLHKTHRHGVWDVHNVLLSPELLLLQSVQKGSLSYAFETAKPKFPAYDRMVKVLQQYRRIAQQGGWPKLPDFKDLKPGMHSEVVPLLRKRLKIEGDYVPCKESTDANSTLYDECLLTAVKHFQARHGLTAEGYIGKKTRKALAESAQHKYVRLRLNIARLKWLKRDTDRYHIVANIPQYEIWVYDDWNVIEKMPIVTGRKGHETPVFYNRVKRIVLNPYWRIPPSIVRHETIPKLKRNPGYAKHAHIEIHTGYSEHSPRVNPYKVNWHKYGKRLPPYKFMQSPGEHNALGKVKFLFPNRYSVYMHDTPEKALFSRDIRAFSHGCVRLGRPFDMLKTFADIDKNIDYDKAQNILKTNKKTALRLSEPIPIDIIYISAWADENGTAQFRDDIYGYDALQMETAKWLPASDAEKKQKITDS